MLIRSVRPDAAQAMHAEIPRSELAIVPDAAHMCILEQPAFINERLATFLAAANAKELA